MSFIEGQIQDALPRKIQPADSRNKAFNLGNKEAGPASSIPYYLARITLKILHRF